MSINLNQKVTKSSLLLNKKNKEKLITLRIPKLIDNLLEIENNTGIGLDENKLFRDIFKLLYEQDNALESLKEYCNNIIKGELDNGTYDQSIEEIVTFLMNIGIKVFTIANDLSLYNKDKSLAYVLHSINNDTVILQPIKEFYKELKIELETSNN